MNDLKSKLDALTAEQVCAHMMPAAWPYMSNPRTAKEQRDRDVALEVAQRHLNAIRSLVSR